MSDVQEAIGSQRVALTLGDLVAGPNTSYEVYGFICMVCEMVSSHDMVQI